MAALLVALHAPRIGAQSVDPRLFDATLSPGALIGVDSTWIPGHLEGYLGLGLTYANDELVGETFDGTQLHAPLATRWIAGLAFGLGLFDRLELQLGATLHAVGDADALGADTKTFGFGDLRAALRLALLRPAGPGFGLALQLTTFLPTGGSAAFSGDDGLVLDPRVVLDWRGSDGVALALHVGYRVRPERRIFDLTIDDELRFGLGLELPLGALGAAIPLALLAEVEGALGLGTTAADQEGSDNGSPLPLEARLGLRLFAQGWAVTLATGTGLSDGYGAPDLRVFLGVSLGLGTLTGPRAEPPGRARVRPELPEPAPFSELVGFADPEMLAQALRDDPDQDGDGVPVPTDACPSAPEDRDGHLDEDGCPDPDNDGDGVADGVDRCPLEAEVQNGLDDEDGCPDALDPNVEPTRVTVDRSDTGQSAIVIKDGVFDLPLPIEFRSGSDVLAFSAGSLITRIAAALRGDPSIKRVLIEGHTDADGDEEMNVDLSERRAARVRGKLIALGIDPVRLLPKGFGATRAVASNKTPEGRKKNRRVTLRVIDPPPPGAPRIDFDLPTGETP